MAAVGETKNSTGRRWKHRRSSSKRNGHFTITAQNSTPLLDQNYDPGVSYSLKKKARWQLLDAVRGNPSSVIDESVSHVEMTIGDDKDGQQFFYKSPSNSVNLRSRKRRKNLNLRSLHNMMRTTASDQDDLTTINFVDFSKKVRRHDKPLKIKTAARTRSRNKVNTFIMDSSMEEDEDDLLESETSNDEFEEVDESEVIPATTLESFIVPENKSRPKKTELVIPERSNKGNILSAPSDFMIDTEQRKTPVPTSVIQRLVDKVTIHPSYASLPFPTLLQLQEKFGAAKIVPGSSLCAINISEMLRSRARLPLKQTAISSHAYVLLEKVGDRLVVRLNCEVQEDINEIVLPSLQDCRDIEEVVEICVDVCARKYPSSTMPETPLCVLSNYRIPLDPQLKLSMERTQLLSNILDESTRMQGTNDSGVDGSCGICLEILQLGRRSSLRCGHEFCDKCWQQHLLTEIAARHHLQCPEFDCKEDVDFVSLLRHISMPMVRRHLHQFLIGRLEEREDIVWCPNLNCGRPISLRGYSRHRSSRELPVNVYCLCGAEFCPACGQEGHWPTPCSVYRLFAEKLRRLGDWKPLWTFGESEIVVVTQSCPNCGRRWEKNGGCNYMQCSRCQVSFCWKCGVRMTLHPGGITCNKKSSMSGSDRRSVIRLVEAPRREASGQRSAEYCEALHFRILAAKASHSLLKKDFGRVLRKSIGCENGCSINPYAIILAYLRAVTQCARASQFCLVTAIAQSNKERAAVLRSFAGRFECLTEPALDALRDVKEDYNTRNREVVLRRLKECQEGGWRTAKMLQAILITWNKNS